jgi:hypothetical protein
MQQPKELLKKKPKLSLSVVMLIIAGLGIIILVACLSLIYLIPKPLVLPSGQSIQARMLFGSPGPYHVGDVIPVKLEVKAVTGVKWEMPDLATADLNDLEIKVKSEVETEQFQGGWGKKISYALTTWQVGKHTIPGLTVNYEDASGAKQKYEIPAITITIASLLPQGKSKEELLALAIKENKGTVGLPPRYQILWWFLVGAAFLAIILLVLWLLRRYWPKKAEVPVEGVSVIVEPAHLIALRRLEALQEAGYLESGGFKIFYSELSEIIREYMENRFQIRALEMTTEEFWVHLTTNNCLNREQQLLLGEFLNFSDLVKFAKHLPFLDEAGRALSKSRQLIEETKAVEVAMEEPGECKM